MTNTLQDNAPSGGITDVLARDMCSGCGGCSVATGGAVRVALGIRGQFAPDPATITSANIDTASHACPFSDYAPSETALSSETYGDLPEDERIGRYRSLFAGRISDTDQILQSSSGGLTSWLTSQMMERNLVDGVIHVGFGSAQMFEYVVSRSVEDLRAAGRRKSRYYPVSFADAVNAIRGDGRRYAFVGIPCQIKAMRLALNHDEVLREQIVFTIGLVCGHMKSARYAESLAWQQGIAPDSLSRVDFRVKAPGRSVREYKFRSEAVDGGFAEDTTGSLVGGNWGHAVFQLNACNYCDDIFAETADIVFGDAWLPEYDEEWRGTNVVVTRDQRLDAILRDGAQEGAIVLDPLTESAVAATQAGNFRHRRAGLAVRLADDRRDGRWAPARRVTPTYSNVSAPRIRVIRARRELTAASHELYARARREGLIDVYLRGIRPFLTRHDQLSKIATASQLGIRGVLMKLLSKARRAPLTRDTRQEGKE